MRPHLCQPPLELGRAEGQHAADVVKPRDNNDACTHKIKLVVPSELLRPSFELRHHLTYTCGKVTARGGRKKREISLETAPLFLIREVDDLRSGSETSLRLTSNSTPTRSMSAQESPKRKGEKGR